MEPDSFSQGLQARPGAQDLQAGYSRLQVVLHWVVAGLVVIQWTTSAAIHRTHDPSSLPSPEDLRLHAFHTYGGIAIGVLMIWRLLLRWRLGAPPAPAGEPRWRARLASAVHLGLYGALLAQATTGFTAGFLWSGAGRFHVLIWNIVVALVAIHLAGVLYHGIRRGGVSSRMTRLGGETRRS